MEAKAVNGVQYLQVHLQHYLMRPPRRKLGDWFEWRVAPLFNEYSTLPRLVLPGFIVGVCVAAALIREGPDRSLRVFDAFFSTFGWLLILAFAWWAGDWDIVQRRNRERALRQRHICIHCGYDLRASPDRCPECGRRVDEPTSRP